MTTVRQVLAGGAGAGTECLVIIYGNNIGRKFDLIEDVLTIGRDPDNTIVLDSDSVSRRHARIERFHEARFVIDLNSTNGTYLNDKPVQPRSQLACGNFIKIGDTIFKYLTGDNIEAAYYEEIYRMAVTDGLTQIANKRQLDDFLDKEMARARRHRRDLSVLMIDIDHFKRVNDLHGHLTGDVVLRELASIVRIRIRREELFARYGGEEFVIVLPETDRKTAIEFAETVCEMVAAHQVAFEGQTMNVTISIGVAQFSREEHKGPEDLVKEADKNLYWAKSHGRNQVHG
ncbi:MAG: diguanylate cyclase [Deltaproteobacteria bacterium]|nr:diguanylate cyclase [Deltaproteobacteria bacterium]